MASKPNADNYMDVKKMIKIDAIAKAEALLVAIAVVD